MQITNNKTKIIFAIVAILVISLLIFFLIKDRSIKNVETESNGMSSTTPDSQIDVGGEGEYTIEQIPIEKQKLPEVPNLNRAITFPKDMPIEVRTIIEGKIKQNIANLKINKSSFDEWLSLGINRKMIEDYVGAKEAWEYASLLNPNNPIPFANLGDLYGYYLKDRGMAEVNILKAIEKDPLTANWYIRATNFYREVIDDLNKAENTLKSGLAKIPNDPSILQALSQIKNLKEERTTSPKPM